MAISCPVSRILQSYEVVARMYSDLIEMEQMTNIIPTNSVVIIVLYTIVHLNMTSSSYLVR